MIYLIFTVNPTSQYRALVGQTESETVLNETMIKFLKLGFIVHIETNLTENKIYFIKYDDETIDEAIASYGQSEKPHLSIADAIAEAKAIGCIGDKFSILDVNKKVVATGEVLDDESKIDLSSE